MKLDAEAIAAHHPLPQWRFLQLTVAILAWMLVSQLIEARWTGHVALQVMLLDLMLVTIWANPHWQRVRRVITILWALSLAASIVAVSGIARGWARIEWTLDIAFTIPVTAACAAGVLGFAFRAERPTLDGVFAMVVAYLLIAVIFALLYYLLLIWDPGALHLTVPITQETLRQLRGDLFYFSLVTISTVGYGDILPVSPTARILATAEAVVGQFYVAVVVATFVAMFTTQAMKERAAARRSGDDHKD